MGNLTVDDINSLVFDRLQEHLEENRDKTDVWEDLFDDCSRNRWASKEMDALVAGGMHLVIYQVNDRGKAINDRNLDSWLDNYMEGEYATAVKADKGYFRSLSSRDQDDVEDIIAEHDRLMEDVEDYWEELEEDSRDRKRGRGGRDRDRDDRGSRERSGQRRRGGSSRGGKSSNVRRRRDDADQEAEQDNDREERAPREERQPRREREQKSATAAPTTRTVTKPNFSGPDHTKARPYDEFWINDQYYQLDSVSKLFPTEHNFDANANRIAPFVHINTAYNPLKQLRYYAVSPDKSVTEEYVDMTREADYITHQRIGGKRRHRTDDSRPERVVRVKDEYVAPVNIPDESATLLRLGRAAESEANLAVIGPFAVSSANALESKGRFAMIRDSKLIQIVEGIIYTTVVARDAEEAAKLMNIANATNCSAAFEALGATEISVDAELLTFVDQRLSAELTHELRCRYGVPVTVSGFSTNYQTLLDLLEKRYDAAMVRGFCQGARHVPNTALKQLEATVKKEVSMDTLGLSEAEYDQAEDRIIVVGDDVSYLMVDATLADISLSFGTAPEIIDGDKFPNFHQLCNLALRSDVPGVRSYILTRDGHRIEVIESPTLRDTVMARLDA